MSWLFIEWNFFGCFNPLIVRPIVSGLFGTSYIKRLNHYVALLLLLFWQKCCSISIFFSQVICIITIKNNLSRKVRSSHQKLFLRKVFFIANWYWQIHRLPCFRRTAARTGIFCLKYKFFFREQVISSAQFSMFYIDKLSQL